MARQWDLVMVSLCIKTAIDKIQLCSLSVTYAGPYHKPAATMGHFVHNFDISKLHTHMTPYLWCEGVRLVGRTATFSKITMEVNYGREITLNSLVTTLVDILAVSMPIAHSLETFVALGCVTKLHILEWPVVVPSPRCTCVMVMLFNQLLDMQQLSDGWIILAMNMEKHIFN